MKKSISFLYRLLVITSLFFGIALNLYHVNYDTIILSYYTLQINIFCLVTLSIFEVLDLLNIDYKKHTFYYLLKGEMIVSVVLMMTVYAFALVPNNFHMYSFNSKINLADILVHIVSPILVILDYLLFDEKGNFKIYYPFTWIFIPLNYVIYVYAYSSQGLSFYDIGGSERFGYLFLDYEKYGYFKVGTWLILIAISIVFMGLLLVLIDYVLRLVKTKGKS